MEKMRFRDEDVERLNNSLKIEEVVGKFVELKKSGANYKGLCPFHPDTTPSFMVSPSKNICKCFVCGAGGNPVSFYSLYQKMPYDKAIKELSDLYKIPVRSVYENRKDDERLSHYREIMREAHGYFCNQIFQNKGREALEYCISRGITPEIIKRFGLGFAPNSRNGLTENLLGKGFELSKLIELGLTKENEKGVYDSFRNRVIFPIFSLENQVIAFGGRTLESDKDIAKYINSPDTPIFKKGNILYGLGEKSSIIKKKNYSILMEGYMDVLMSTIHGFDVTLAPLGTALTEEQCKLLKRYTTNVILAFDADAAGQKATEKGILTLKKSGFSIRVIELKEAKDPDEYIKKNGKEAFLERVKNSVESFDFLFNYYSKEFDLSNVLSKQNFINRFKEFFQAVENKIEKSLYLDKLSKNIGIEKEILWETLVTNNTAKVVREIESPEEKGIFEDKTEEKENVLEKLSIALILSNIKFYKYFYKKPFKNHLIKKILIDIEKNFSDENKFDEKKLLTNPNYSEKEKNRIFEYTLLKFNAFPSVDKQQEFLIQILKDWLRLEMNDLKKEKRDIMTVFSLKMIETELNDINNIEKYEKIYDKFLIIAEKNEVL